MMREWKALQALCAPKLSPNKKDSQRVIRYVADHYHLIPYENREVIEEIAACIAANNFTAQKLPRETKPDVVAFILAKDEKSAALYAHQEPMWENCPIFFAIDRVTGHLQVEGSCELYDRIVAFQGVEAWDIQNPSCLGDYIACIKKYRPGEYERLLG